MQFVTETRATFAVEDKKTGTIKVVQVSGSGDLNIMGKTLVENDYFKTRVNVEFYVSRGCRDYFCGETGSPVSTDIKGYTIGHVEFADLKTYFTEVVKYNTDRVHYIFTGRTWKVARGEKLHSLKAVTAKL